MRNPENLHKESACISREDLIRYLNGQTDKKETRRIELHISECLLCGDAVEGFQKKGNYALLPSEFEGLEKELLKKYAAPSSGVIPLWRKLSAAAAILIFFGISLYFITLQLNKPKDKTLITQTETTVPQPEPAVEEEKQTESPNDKAPVLADNAKPTEIQKTHTEEIKKESSPTPNLSPKFSEKAQEIIVSTEKQDSKVSGQSSETPIANKVTATKKPDNILEEEAKVVVKESASQPEIVSTTQPMTTIPSAPSVTPGNYYDASKDNKQQEDFASIEHSKKKNRSEHKDIPAKSETLSLESDSYVLDDVKATEFSLYQQGINEKKNKNYRKSIELLSSIPSYDPKYEDAQWAIAECYEKLGDKESANAIYDALVNRKSKYTNKAKKATSKK